MQPQTDDKLLERIKRETTNIKEDKYYKIVQVCNAPLKISAFLFTITENPLLDEMMIEKYTYKVLLSSKSLSVERTLLDQRKEGTLFECIKEEYKKKYNRVVRVFDTSQDRDPGGCYGLINKDVLRVLFHSEEEMNCLLSILIKADEIPVKLWKHSIIPKLDVTRYIQMLIIEEKELQVYLHCLVSIWYELGVLVRPSFVPSCTINLEDIKKRFRLKKVKGVSKEIMNLVYFLIYGIRLVDSYVGLFESFAPPSPLEDQE